MNTRKLVYFYCKMGQINCKGYRSLYTSQDNVLTINVPVVFIARYVMVLRSATSLRGALEGVGPEN